LKGGAPKARREAALITVLMEVFSSKIPFLAHLFGLPLWLP